MARDFHTSARWPAHFVAQITIGNETCHNYNRSIYVYVYVYMHTCLNPEYSRAVYLPTGSADDFFDASVGVAPTRVNSASRVMAGRYLS